MTTEKPSPWNPYARDSVLSTLTRSPALIGVGFFLLDRLPTSTDWILPVSNWIAGAAAFLLGYAVSRNTFPTRSAWLWTGAFACFVAEGSLYMYDRHYRTTLTLEWPDSVPSNEAVVGGRIRNIDETGFRISLFVCVKTKDKPGCFLDQHPQLPLIEGESWVGRVRLGNERSENDHGHPEFFVIAAALRLDQPPPDSNLPKTASLLRERLLGLAPAPAAVSAPLKIGKTLPPPPSVLVAELAERDRVTPVPRLRAPNYSTCPPTEVRWTNSSGQAVEAAVEAWQDGRRHGTAASATSYHIRTWPPGIERIEVKVSPAQGKGPYDTVWLKHGVCSDRPQAAE